QWITQWVVVKDVHPVAIHVQGPVFWLKVKEPGLLRSIQINLLSVEDLNNYGTFIKKRALYRTPLGSKSGCYERIRQKVCDQDLVKEINDLSGLCRPYLCCA